MADDSVGDLCWRLGGREPGERLCPLPRSLGRGHSPSPEPGEGLCPLPRKKFRFLSSKRWVLVHSGCYFCSWIEWKLVRLLNGMHWLVFFSWGRGEGDIKHVFSPVGILGWHVLSSLPKSQLLMGRRKLLKKEREDGDMTGEAVPPRLNYWRLHWSKRERVSTQNTERTRCTHVASRNRLRMNIKLINIDAAGATTKLIHSQLSSSSSSLFCSLK